MSNANRDYAIVYDAKNSSLVLSRPLNFYITDKNTSNIFIKLVTRVTVGNGIDQYTDIENASNYVLTMRVIKPNNEVKSLKATQHEPENIFQFDLTEDFKDIPGKYICELTMSTIVSSRQELITSDPFIYEVKRSILSNVGEIIETEDTTVEKLLNDLDTTKAELSSRIDNLTTLTEGSTTGDAELIDGRIGANGVTYNNIGTAIRTQINMIAGDISGSNTITITDDFSGNILGVDIFALKDQIVEVKISCDSSVLADTLKIPVGIVTTNDVHVDELYEIIPNKTYKLKFNYNIKRLKTWIGAKLSNGEVVLTASTKNIYDSINELDNNYVDVYNKLDYTHRLLCDKDISNLYKVSNSMNKVDNENFTIGVNGSFKKGEKIYISLDADCIKETSNIPGAITYPSGEQQEAFEVKPHSCVEFIPEQDATFIRLWIPNSYFTSKGIVTLTVENYIPLNDKVADLNDKVAMLVDSRSVTRTLTIGDDFSGDIIPIGITAYKRQTIEVKVSCDNSILADGYKIPVAIVTTDNETINEIAEITPNKLYKLKFDYNIKELKFWIGGKSANGDVIATATVKNIYNYTNEIAEELEDRLASLRYQGLTFSILGDSYSSYKGWIPQANEYWYADEGNSNPENNVASVTDTWWYKLSKETGMPLLINNSYSGSTVSTTGYSGGDATGNSFTTRMVNTLGEKRVLEPKPNIIFIFGGTNDSWANSPIGELKYSDWSTEDLKSFLPAFCYMIAYIKKYNPQARIINIINNDLKSEISNGMSVACQYYNIENVVLSNIGKTGGHPNKEGMEAIKNQIISIL